LAESEDLSKGEAEVEAETRHKPDPDFSPPLADE